MEMGDLGRFLLSALITVIVTIAVMSRFPVQKKGKRLKEQAVARGFVAAAHLIDSRDTSVVEVLSREHSTDFPRTVVSYKTVYEYEVNGRTYRVKAVLDRFPPACINVYYPNGDPNKVFLDGYEPDGALPAMLRLVPLVVMAIIYHLLGRIG